MRRPVPRRYWVFFKMKLINGNWIRHLSGFQLLHKVDCSERYYEFSERLYCSFPWDQWSYEKQLYFVVNNILLFLEVVVPGYGHKSKISLLLIEFLVKVKYRFFNNSAQLLITISKRGVCDWPHLPFHVCLGTARNFPWNMNLLAWSSYFLPTYKTYLFANVVFIQIPFGDKCIRHNIDVSGWP